MMFRRAFLSAPGGRDAKAALSSVCIACQRRLWVAEQIAESIDSCGAATFLDRRDIAAGDNFKQRIRDEMPSCDELLALFTPWSRHRAWVRHEIGMADALGKRTVCVLYKVSITDFDAEQDGRGPLDDLNFVDINALETYFKELKKRAR